MRTPQPSPRHRQFAIGPPEHLESTWSVQSGCSHSSLTSRAGELRSAPSGENRATGKRALTLGPFLSKKDSKFIS